MPGLVKVLPYRNETGITLKQSGLIEISQTDGNGENQSVEIHVSDAPLLIDALKSAVDSYNAELNPEGRT